ncbi:MAG: hypothetical protein A2Z18_03000 [Armatimonadetes bacterium RBG_16_58_9]|nr:MAG: hypothetical protein A2Z18_03000 [Armatimonadetes bacterium RBG_16_58_9]
MTTLANGYRAVGKARVLAYTDKNGAVLYHGPLIKGLFKPTPWEWKIELASERAQSAYDARRLRVSRTRPRRTRLSTARQ